MGQQLTERVDELWNNLERAKATETANTISRFYPRKIGIIIGYK